MKKMFLGLLLLVLTICATSQTPSTSKSETKQKKSSASTKNQTIQYTALLKSFKKMGKGITLTIKYLKETRIEGGIAPAGLVSTLSFSEAEYNINELKKGSMITITYAFKHLGDGIYFPKVSIKPNN